MVCSAFGGTPGECKIAVGGVQDCCEKPKNISLADYLQLIMSVPKLDAGIMALEEGNVVRGAYQTLRQPITQGWNEVTKPFASYAENITGAVDNFFQPVEEFVDKAVEKLTEQIQKIMADVFKSAGQDAAIEEAATSAATQATESLANGAASWMSTVSTIYTAYVVTMVMIQMVWKCEEEEFTMNAQRQLKNCTYVGDYCKSDSPFGCIEKREAYCCFNSPLSRIIQEQVRGQLGRNFGSARNPECGGIPLDQIADIDWERVDLDEWLGILQANGQFPSSHEDLNLETLTGAGSPFNTDGDRLSAGDRAAARLDGIDVDAKRREAMEVFIPETGGPAF